MDISKYRGVGGRGSRNMRGRGFGGRGNNYKSNPIPEKTNLPVLPIEIQNPLSPLQKNYFISLFPQDQVKLSYETVAPKKVSSPEYDLCLAIPYGKKAYVWFTYYYHHSICLLLELNRDNIISDYISFVTFDNKTIPVDFELGTILSGTIYEKEINPDLPVDVDRITDKVFMLDDIHIYKGLSVSKFVFREKTGFLNDFFVSMNSIQNSMQIDASTSFTIQLPFIWNSSIQTEIPANIPYNIRHIQHRSTSKIIPHINVSMNRKPVWAPTIIADSTIYMKEYKFNFSKPIYRKNAFFYVKADIAYDVYYLGAQDKKGNVVYFQHSLIMNYKTSILLNSIFRNIRENACLDAIEDSDDESDFENVREDKYVDLEKRVLMECTFHAKFKKWMPMGIVDTLEKPSLLELLL